MIDRVNIELTNLDETIASKTENGENGENGENVEEEKGEQEISIIEQILKKKKDLNEKYGKWNLGFNLETGNKMINITKMLHNKGMGLDVDQKKALLTAEQAVTLGYLYKEIAGIWAGQPAGLEGIPLKLPATISATARGLGNVQAIETQKNALSAKKVTAAEGYQGVVDAPTQFTVGEAGAEMVDIQPLEREGITQSPSIVISGNVMTQDYVEGELSEAIIEAVRRGTDLGL